MFVVLKAVYDVLLQVYSNRDIPRITSKRCETASQQGSRRRGDDNVQCYSATEDPRGPF